MHFNRVDQAIRILEDLSLPATTRDEAAQYLVNLDNEDEIRQLVATLSNDDFGVRYEAAHLLAMMGSKALPALLEALVNPKLVADSRIREGVMHVLRNNHDPQVIRETATLRSAIKGWAPDLYTMREADHLLEKYRPKHQDKQGKVE